MRAVFLNHNIPIGSLLKYLAIVALIAAVAAPLQSQTLRGQVVDSVNTEPITGLDLVLLDARGDTAAVAKSGAYGRFEFTVPAGAYTLCVRCIGHRPKQVAIDVPSSTPVVVRLAQLSIPPSS